MSNIDQSLDDIIKSNKGARSGGKRRRGGGGAGGVGPGGAGGGRASGPVRNAPNRLGTRPTPYSIGKRARRSSGGGGGGGAGVGAGLVSDAGAWQHDMFEEGFGGGAASGRKPVGIETGTKLFISNLDHGVSTDDIKELFSEQGDLKRCAVHFDRSGRSKCTAEVVFARKYDALKAMKHYNNVQLDGKPMKIECLGTNIATAFAPSSVNAAVSGVVNGGAVRAAAPMGRGRIGKRIRRKPVKGAGGGGGGGGGVKGRAGGKTVVKSAQELDADLENYHAEAMQT